jgi:L-serine dehydratase
MGGDLGEVVVEYDVHGSLATTHRSQGSDMGLFAGLMGWDATDERLPDSGRTLRETSVHVSIKTGDFHDRHPSTYHLTLLSPRERHVMTAISKGGGMIEVIGLDGFPLSVAGDYWETLIWLKAGGAQTRFTQAIQADYVLVHEGPNGLLIQIKAQRFVEDPEILGCLRPQEVQHVKRLSPVLPVLSRRDIRVPFSTCAEILRCNDGRNRPLWELAVQYESERAGLSAVDVTRRMVEIVRIVRSSVERRIQGTAYHDRILGHQCGVFKQRMAMGRLLDAGLMNRIVLYVTALGGLSVTGTSRQIEDRLRRQQSGRDDTEAR